MRQFNLKIFCLYDLFNSIINLWTTESYARNQAAYWLKPSAMPINSGVECLGVPSDQFDRFKFSYSRILAFLKMPAIFWH